MPLEPGLLEDFFSPSPLVCSDSEFSIFCHMARIQLASIPLHGISYIFPIATRSSSLVSWDVDHIPLL